ncbi:MAG: PEGA domain-containing protein [Phycisphaerales bacterium]|nr:PEGA domain-containing protein [Phycisphaerales bacterium]
MCRTARNVTVLCIILGGLIMPGCVRRTISVTSDPPGALLWLNGREIGRTPVEVDFIYYGDYDVVLVADGFEPLLTHGKADPPLWDIIPFDLLAELTPGRKQARIEWHYELEPRNDDPAGLLDRARQLRDRATEPIDAQTQAPGQVPAK